jgi:acylphosphatase
LKRQRLFHLNIKIHGRVQGVFFRQSAREKAGELNISGFARNDPDGAVYIEAEGEENNLRKFLEWCRKGPAPASVEKLEFEFCPEIKNFADFTAE